MLSGDDTIMMDKKTFGLYIKSKRIEKNYSQKELAEILFVTEGAISKWERGVSYPDITLVSDICRALEISEHELITASTDTDARKMKQEAKKFRMIRGVWFWVPTISYLVALITCFICNLAVNHTLSWFFVVLASLVCAYTFVPTLTCFFEKCGVLIFSVSTYLSIILLLFTCALYTNGLYWFLTACIGILIGYVLLFIPILLSKTKLTRYKFIISFILAFVLTVLLLLSVQLIQIFALVPAILIACYAYMPVLVCAVICACKFDGFLKAGVCVAVSALVGYFVEYVVDKLLGTNASSYQVDFSNWGKCMEGNVGLICLVSLLFISIIFTFVGIIRVNIKKTD